MKKADRQARRLAILIGLVTLCLTPHLFSQQSPTDLQTNLEDLEVGGDWMYGDLDKGIALAKESGKPLFVLFR